MGTGGRAENLYAARQGGGSAEIRRLTSEGHGNFARRVVDGNFGVRRAIGRNARTECRERRKFLMRLHERMLLSLAVLSFSLSANVARAEDLVRVGGFTREATSYVAESKGYFQAE